MTIAATAEKETTKDVAVKTAEKGHVDVEAMREGTHAVVEGKFLKRLIILQTVSLIGLIPACQAGVLVLMTLTAGVDARNLHAIRVNAIEMTDTIKAAGIVVVMKENANENVIAIETIETDAIAKMKLTIAWRHIHTSSLKIRRKSKRKMA